MDPSLPPDLPTPPEKKFTLPLLAWLLWGLYAMGFIGVFLVRHRGEALPADQNGYETGQLIGQILGSFLIPVIPAWLIWRLSGRSAIARNVTFFALFGLLVVGQLATFGRRAQASARLHDLQAERDQMRAEQRAALEKGEPVDEKKANDLVRRASEQMGEMAQNSTGQEKAIAEAGQAFMNQILKAKEHYDDAGAAFAGGAFWELGGLKTKEAVAERRKNVQAFAAANDELSRLQEPKATVFRQELETRKIARIAIDQTITGYQKSAGSRLQAMGKIRETDGQLAQTMLEFLDLAEANLGRWKVREGGAVVFEDAAAAERYNELLGRVEKISIEQAAAQQQLLAPKK